jgi:hypothetical protein
MSALSNRYIFKIFSVDRQSLGTNARKAILLVIQGVKILKTDCASCDTKPDVPSQAVSPFHVENNT